jgi:hypothetical protein
MADPSASGGTAYYYVDFPAFVKAKLNEEQADSGRSWIDGPAHTKAKKQL